MKSIDDHEYWKKRHSENKGIISVGHHRYSQKANYYNYLIVQQVYDSLLEKLELKNKNLKVLDAGCGIGIFSKFLKERGFGVTAVDISQDAIDCIKKGMKDIDTICSPLYQLNLPKNSFDVVHCFDVLYHILDDEEWEKTLEKFALVSKRYIILHERFSNKKEIYTSPHVNFRGYSDYKDRLGDLGFKEILSKPTHVVGNGLYSGFITRLFPKIIYGIDHYLIFRLDANFNRSLIKVLEKE